MITLENEKLRVQVLAKGAELCSIFFKPTQQELLWQADKTFWPRHAPVLFPIVGRLKNDRYTHEGREYTLTQHGFARDMDFSVEEISATQVSMVLEHNAHTLQLYPFPFRLLIRYTLQNMTLSCTYEVVNTGNNTLYFSVGAHPGFVYDPGKSGSRLVFNQPEKATRWLLQNGCFSGETEALLDGSTLPLTEKLFEQDAVVFKNMKSDRVTLQQEGLPGISMTFAGFPFLGIWKKPEAPFLCIEPWCGIADSIQHNGELKTKEGIRTLETGGVFKALYQIIID